MLMMLVMMVICFLISMIMLVIYNFISEKMYLDFEKLSPYECGFNPLKKARVPFSLRFFLVIIIFLVFDVEIALLLPLGILVKTFFVINLYVSFYILLFIMTSGFVYEWHQGSLNWEC